MTTFLYFTTTPVFLAFMNMAINRLDSAVSAAIIVYLTNTHFDSVTPPLTATSAVNIRLDRAV